MGGLASLANKKWKIAERLEQRALDAAQKDAPPPIEKPDAPKKPQNPDMTDKPNSPPAPPKNIKPKK